MGEEYAESKSSVDISEYGENGCSVGYTWTSGLPADGGVQDVLNTDPKEPHRLRGSLRGASDESILSISVMFSSSVSIGCDGDRHKFGSEQDLMSRVVDIESVE